jgi:hypothetical protein
MRDLKYIKLEHQRLALLALFTDDEVTYLQTDHDSTFSDEEISRIGIVQGYDQGKPQFIHPTFAEFFVAEFLIKQLAKEMKQENVLINIVLLRTDYQVTRCFLNGLLKKTKPSTLALKDYGRKLEEQWNEREVHGSLEGVTTELHNAATEDNARIVGFLLDSLGSGECSNTLNKMLLATDAMGRTAWHMAAETNGVEALKLIWKWVGDRHDGAERGHSEASDTTRASVKEEELQHNQLRHRLFVAKDKYGYTAWHRAAEGGSLEALELLWIWAKEVEVNQVELLLAESEDGKTAFSLAEEKNHEGILQALSDWAK